MLGLLPILNLVQLIKPCKHKFNSVNICENCGTTLEKVIFPTTYTSYKYKITYLTRT